MEEISRADLEEYYYVKGKLAMAWDVAINKDGKLYIGVMQIPYSKFILPYVEELKRIVGKYNMTQCQFEQCEGCLDCR